MFALQDALQSGFGRFDRAPIHGYLAMHFLRVIQYANQVVNYHVDKERKSVRNGPFPFTFVATAGMESDLPVDEDPSAVS